MTTDSQPVEPHVECQLCNQPTVASDLQTRFLPEFQTVMSICGCCRSKKIHWDPNQHQPSGDVDVT